MADDSSYIGVQPPPEIVKSEDGISTTTTIQPPAIVSSSDVDHDVAVTKERENFESMLMEYLKDKNPRNDQHCAKFQKQEEAMRVLARCSPDIFRRKYKFDKWDSEAYPMAMVCALQSSKEIIKIVFGLCPEALGEAFCYACRYETDTTAERLQWLLGLQQQQQHDDKPGPLKYVNPESGHTPLHCACLSRTLASIRFLYDNYPEAIATKSKKGNVPLHIACQFGTLEIVEFLVRQKSESIHVNNNAQETPFHYALLNKSGPQISKIVKYLLNKFKSSNLAKKEIENGQGRLPLHYACRNSFRSEPIKLLLENCLGAITKRDKQGNSPLALVVQNNDLKEKDKEEVIELLAHADPDALTETDAQGKPSIGHGTVRKLLVSVMRKDSSIGKRRRIA